MKSFTAATIDKEQVATAKIPKKIPKNMQFNRQNIQIATYNVQILV